MALSACGSGISGTYTDANNIESLTFNSGGKVLISTMGIETESTYKVEDGKVKIETPQGTLLMTLLPDGSIQGPMDIKLTKKKS